MKLKLDPCNANKGTARGRKLLRTSLEKLGAGRSILVDKNGVVIAGNKTFEVAEALGIPVRVVETNGTELVAVQRTDLDLEDGDKARQLALADNRVGEVDLEWDVEVLRKAVEAGVDLSGLWTEEEIERLRAGVGDVEWGWALAGVGEGEEPGIRCMTFTFDVRQWEDVQEALALALARGPLPGFSNENKNGNAMHRICREWYERGNGETDTA